MFSNFLKITFRKLLRSKGVSSINILGLTIGMASSILILLWIQSEVSTDQFHENVSNLYWMYNRNKVNGEMTAISQTPSTLAAALKHAYPEVEQVTRINDITFLVTAGEKHLNVRGGVVDSSFLTMFSFPLLKGNAEAALNNPTGIVLTAQLAKKLFGDEDAFGKTVRIDSNANFKVTGVLQDLPNNTSFDFEYLLPRSFMVQLGWEDNQWSNISTFTYVLLKPNSSQAAFDSKVKNIIIDHTKGSSFESSAEVFTQPMSRAYLYSTSQNGKLVGGRIEMVKLFSIIAAFTLLIACINFMNLSTARSEKRAKEVGIRKVSGAHRSSLILQFIGESILLSFIAFVLAVLIVQLSLPAFNELIGKTLFIDQKNPMLWMFSLGFVLIIGLIAGSYPALYLSSFTPVKVLKGTLTKAGALITPRKVLVVLQFSFAIALIISTIIVKHQIEFARERDLGYNKNNLVFAFTQGDAAKNYQLIKHDLISSGAATSVTRTANPITQRWGSGWGYNWNGATATDKHLEFIEMGGDADFVKTMGLKLLEGRDIDMYNYPSDTSSLLLNESAVKAMHLKNPVGQIIRREGGYNQQWTVVGVVKDFILESPLESNINPTMIKGPSYFFQVIHFKLNPANSTAANLSKAEAIFKKYNPQYPFEYVFVDEAYDRKFKEVTRTGKLSMLFAGLTIFISCLGLFGLATYMAENRVKEIGVRKVLGASVGTITVLLSKDFLKLVLIAFLIASPVAYYCMNDWLQNYTYRVDIEWWVFAGAGLMSVLIAVITISYQAIKAAVANPVKSLRSE